MKSRIGVFLSSKADLRSPEYLRAASEVGEWIGKTGRTLVYGGARKGQMEVLASAVKKYGGRVFGVVPQVIVDHNLVSECVDISFHTADLSDRKAVMMRESEILVALPGGVGTLDEVFTALAATILGLYDRTVVLYNAGGCWDRLLDTLDKLKQDGLIDGNGTRHLAVVHNIEELERLCQ